jgi:hypothetical protein
MCEGQRPQGLTHLRLATLDSPSGLRLAAVFFALMFLATTWALVPFD